MSSTQGKDPRGHIDGFREAIDTAARQGPEAFFTWFDRAQDADMAFVRGSWDFTFHIALPLAPYLHRPEAQTVLEIGHGGGRVLAAASRSFGQALGVDIHAHNDLVLSALQSRGVRNVTLFQSDGQTLPVEDCTVDCVYSFIVLQHVERIAIFHRYLAESYRVLKPGGLALLYFGRRARFSLDRKSRLLYALDLFVEALHRPGYQELSAAVNAVNLIVSARYARAAARRLGFQVLRTLVSRKRVPDGLDRYGGQHGLLLRKGGKGD